MVQTVYAIRWTEYERGWGSRPDGLTLHSSLDVAQEYVRAYWAKMPNSAPDEYSRPDAPELMEVDARVAKKVAEAGSLWANPTGYTVNPEYIFR